MSDLNPNMLGETAAVITSFLWTMSSIFFTSAGRKIGSLSVNAYRTVIALGLLLAAHVILLGSVLPFASSAQWFWMGISGVVGLCIGDSGLFAAYVVMGPRRSLLVMALSPIFASVLAFMMLGEVISTLALVGMAITLGGIMLVVLESEERSGESPLSKRMKGYGFFFALIGAAGQGVGLVLAKKGIDLNPSFTLDPLSATLMRMAAGALSLWLVLLVAGRLPELRRAFSSGQGMNQTVAAAFLGPFLGVTLSMVAVTYAQAGVAQTLMSLSPVLIIPVIWILHKQRTSWRGILGAAISLLGVSILFLV